MGAPATYEEVPYVVETEPQKYGVREVLALFRRHIWLILIVATIPVGIAAYMASKHAQMYRAESVIRLVDRFQYGADGSVEATVVWGADPVLSEIMVLTGRSVLGETVDRAGLRLFSTRDHAPAPFVEDVDISLPPQMLATIRLEFTDKGVYYGQDEERRLAPYGEPLVFKGARFTVPRAPFQGPATLRVLPREAVIDFLESRVRANPGEGTGGIHVTVVSSDPYAAPHVVNAVVETYRDVNARNARRSIVQRRTFLEEQLRTTDSLLMTAQTGLSDLRRSSQAYSAAGRFTVEQGNLIQTEIEQARLGADLRMHENILNRVLEARSSGGEMDLNSLMSMPGIASDPVVGQLYSQLATYRTEREGMVTGPWARASTHPDVQRLNTLIASTEANLIQAVRNHIGSLQAQIGALGAVRGRAAAEMSGLSETEVQEVTLTKNLAALQQMADQLRQEYQAIRLQEAGASGIVEIVQLSSRAMPIPSKAWVTILLGLVVGLMLGGGAAVARELFDDSINTPKDIEEMLLVPNLAVIPRASPHLLDANGNGGPRARIADEPEGAEAYRILRTNLLFSQGALKTLVVTSAAPGEGKTMTAVNLAAACARQGLKVLLMECDLRRPTVGRYFDSPEGSDLATVLSENRPWVDAIAPSKVDGLDVLLAGKAFPRAGEFLAGAEMKGLLEEMSSRYDMVILDTSPLLVAADATVLGAIADGVLLVVRASQTDRAAVQQAVHQLVLVGARVVGTVLNDPDGSVAQYSHYYDYSAEYEVG
jgi:capsular exopolysaccharide synthesis family protein